MFSWLRTFVVCLLVLALPGQGMAAALMMNCADSHQRLYGTEAPQTARDSHHHDEAAQGVQGHHGHHAAATASADGVASDGHASAQDGAYKCAACAACCSPAALPGLAPVLPQPHRFNDWDAAPIRAVIGFVTTAPERPPRPLLA